MKIFSVLILCAILLSAANWSGSSGAPTVESCTVTWTADSGTPPTYVASTEKCVVTTSGKTRSASYNVNISSGTSGTGTYRMSIPGGGTIDTTNLLVNTGCQGSHFGKAYINQGGTYGIGFVGVYDSTHLCIRITAGGMTLAALASTYFGFADAKILSFTVEGLPMQ